ncbi:hypothetical protein L083_1893 [Actinoplanes sp. N902-109]|nr:hypothetical protein L083_1893 [Actinoplanes sp. N902-109]
MRWRWVVVVVLHAASLANSAERDQLAAAGWCPLWCCALVLGGGWCAV